MIKFWLIIVCLALFITACSDDEDTINENSPAMLHPLSIGNEWVYLNVNNDTIIFYDTLQCIGSKNIKGLEYFSLKYTNSFSSISLINKANGLYCLSDTINNEDICLAKYPCSVGDSFRYVRNYTFVVLSTDEMQRVPAGLFKCIKYQSITPVGVLSVRIDNWYSIGIGLVRTMYAYKLITDSDSLFKTISDKQLIRYSIL